MQHLCVVTLHLHGSTSRRMETMTRLLAGAQVVLCGTLATWVPCRQLHPQQSAADVVGEDAAMLAAAAGVLLLARTSSSRFKKHISLLHRPC
jgi:hypothetical protein